MKITKSKLLAVLAAGAFASADGAVIVVAPTATMPGSLQFTQDISFTVTGSGTLAYIVFMDWVISDSTLNGSLVNGVTYNVNNTPIQSMNLMLYDNRRAYDDSPTSNNGSLEDPNLDLNTGDIFTLKANSYTLNPSANFNPLVTQTFTGNMVLVSLGEGIMSNIVSVPEPSTVFVASLGIMAFSRRYRRRPVEQAGAGQPAPRPAVEPKGGDKPHPDAEGRSR
jgi:hypothetical protein